jgi:microcompartment protein CcmL/EutN
MREALGLVETRGLSTAILVADAMSKTANINIIGMENSRGLGYMTIKICGDVGAVSAAVTCGKQIAIENNAFVSAKVIPRPSNSIEVTFCQLNNKKDDDLKENTESKKNNNEESSFEIEDVIKGEDIKTEKEPLNNATNSAESLEDNVEKTSAEIEEVKEKVEEKSADIEKDKLEGKVSTTEKTKIKRNSRKKSEPKKNEE